MEFTVHWFWALKAMPLVFLVLLVYTYVNYRCRSRSVYCWLIGMAVIFSSIASSTIKLKSEAAAARQTVAIEKTKVLPEKKEDNSFQQNTNAIKGISKEDLK